MLRWPLAIGTAGGILLWALAQYDVISKWTFAVTLVVLVVAVMPMLPALFVPAIAPARRAAMATLMVAALATAVGIDWGEALDVNGHRVLVMAGRPARIAAVMEPPGSPPRSITDPRLLPLQAELLHALQAAKLAA